MYILLTDKNTAAEIIPDENPVFPGVPIEERYSPDFVAKLLHVDDATEVQQGWSYVDGTFVKPIVPEPEIPPETMPDYIADLRAAKTTAMSATCQQTIYDGLDIELSDGSTEHYDYKALDQTNIKSMFDGVTNLGITEFPYQSEDGSCRVYSAADIITIYTSLEDLRISQLTYYHQLKEYVATLATAEDIEAVTYGQPLTGDYLTHYNDMVAVAMEQMQQAIQRRVTTNG